MSNRTDAKRDALLNVLSVSGGDTNGLERDWLLGLITSPVGNSLPDLWKTYLDEQGITAGHPNDRWYEWLGGLGWTGSLPERWQQFWENGADTGGGGNPYGDAWVMIHDGQFGTIRLRGTQASETDVHIDWGDGDTGSYTNTATIAHYYDPPAGEEHIIQINGIWKGWDFGSDSDLGRFLEIVQFGDTGLEDMYEAFYANTSYLNDYARSVSSGDCNTPNLNSIYYAFYYNYFTSFDLSTLDVGGVDGSSGFNSPFGYSYAATSIDVSNWAFTALNADFSYFCYTCEELVTFKMNDWTGKPYELHSLLDDCPALTTFESNGLDMSGCNNIRNMFSGCTALVDPGGVADWDVGLITNASGFMGGVTLPTAEYDAILIGWGSQSLQSGVIIDFGNSKYTAGGAAEAGRDAIVAEGWTITDGGAA